MLTITHFSIYTQPRTSVWATEEGEVGEENGGHSRQKRLVDIGQDVVITPRMMEGTDMFHLKVDWEGKWAKHNPA